MQGGSLTSMTAPLFLLDTDSDDTPLATDELHTGWLLKLPQRVRQHAIKSMRLGRGSELQLSDGRGLKIQARITDEETGLVEVMAVGREQGPDIDLVLVQSLAKGGHDEVAIDAATQVGADAILPWQADRSIAKWKPGRTDKKWRQVLDSATEQSRRAIKPTLLTAMTSKELVHNCQTASRQGNLTILLHQDGDKAWKDAEAMAGKLSKGSCIRVLVGPEGGVSDTEVGALAEAGALVTALGGNILRASTAGPVALTLLSRVLGRIGS